MAYELGQKTYKKTSPEFVAHEALEDLYRHIQATLQLLDYAPRGDSDLEKTIMRNLKHLIGRAGLTEWELKMIHGLCAQVEKRIKTAVSRHHVQEQINMADRENKYSLDVGQEDSLGRRIFKIGESTTLFVEASAKALLNLHGQYLPQTFI